MKKKVVVIEQQMSEQVTASTGTTAAEEASASTLMEEEDDLELEEAKAEERELRKRVKKSTDGARQLVAKCNLEVRKAESALRHELSGSPRSVRGAGGLQSGTKSRRLPICSWNGCTSRS